jgi:hypothetical protein
VTGRSLVQKSSIECGVSECDREASTMRGPWPTGAAAPMEQNLCKYCRISSNKAAGPTIWVSNPCKGKRFLFF